MNGIMFAMSMSMAAAIAVVIPTATRHPRRRSRYGPGPWDRVVGGRSTGKQQPGKLMRSIWDPPRPQGGAFQSVYPTLEWRKVLSEAS
jgi:hypothetical protein